MTHRRGGAGSQPLDGPTEKAISPLGLGVKVTSWVRFTPHAITVYPLAFLSTILGAPLAVGSGYFAWRYWRRLRQDVKNDFNGQMDLFADSYTQAMADLTERERSRLLQYGQQILEPVLAHFQAIGQTAEQGIQELDAYGSQAEALRKEIDAVPEEEPAE